jgi:hypothetical protein
MTKLLGLPKDAKKNSNVEVRKIAIGQDAIFGNL